MDEAKSPARPVPWMALAFMLFVLLLLGGIVAISYSPLIDHLFRTVSPEPVSRPPSDQAPNAPGPDNTINQAAPQFPGPDNSATNAPAPAGGSR